MFLLEHHIGLIRDRSNDPSGLTLHSRRQGCRAPLSRLNSGLDSTTCSDTSSRPRTRRPQLINQVLTGLPPRPAIPPRFPSLNFA